ncbi:MAG TPA: NAD(P)-dependent oxidoreductase, partial [Thermomicrobiales bacterium]|nr:NAD(P)-dependent oxidoreductase [Thermomicrobiales bacterium]
IAATRTPRSKRALELDIARLVGMEEIDSVLAETDFLVVAVPLDRDTTGLLGARELALLKPDAYLINVARGPVIDENALFEVLADHRIAGAAIDVWYQYPDDRVHGVPASRPFHELDNAILTPHIAGWTFGTFAHRWERINDNLHRLATGLPLRDIVSPSH